MSMTDQEIKLLQKTGNIVFEGDAEKCFKKHEKNEQKLIVRAAYIAVIIGSDSEEMHVSVGKDGLLVLSLPKKITIEETGEGKWKSSISKETSTLKEAVKEVLKKAMG